MSCISKTHQFLFKLQLILISNTLFAPIFILLPVFLTSPTYKRDAIQHCRELRRVSSELLYYFPSYSKHNEADPPCKGSQLALCNISSFLLKYQIHSHASQLLDEERQHMLQPLSQWEHNNLLYSTTNFHKLNCIEASSPSNDNWNLLMLSKIIRLRNSQIEITNDQ